MDKELIKTVKKYIEEGYKLKEIAQMLGMGLSKIKKISTKIKRDSPVKKALRTLKDNPNIPVKSLGLTNSQADMLYRHPTWKKEILPLRVLNKLKTNVDIDYNKFISRLDKEMLETLQKHPEWESVLAARKEFEEFSNLYNNIFKKHKKDLEKSEKIYLPDGSFADLKELEDVKKKIPEGEKRAGKRKIDLMNDFLYVQTLNNITVLRGKIQKKKMRFLYESLNNYTKETQTLIFKFLKLEDNCTAGANKKWQDINELFRIAEIKGLQISSHKSREKESFYGTAKLYKENLEFVNS